MYNIFFNKIKFNISDICYLIYHFYFVLEIYRNILQE